jgi:hypothetical protein
MSTINRLKKARFLAVLFSRAAHCWGFIDKTEVESKCYIPRTKNSQVWAFKKLVWKHWPQ